MTVIYQCLNAHYIFMNVVEAQEKEQKEMGEDVEVGWRGSRSGRDGKAEKKIVGERKERKNSKALMHKVIQGRGQMGREK